MTGKHKAVNKDEPAFGREYDTGLTKREYIAVEMMKANVISLPENDAAKNAENALKDTEALFEALNKKHGD